MIDQINKLKSSPETSHYVEDTWISRRNQNKVVLFLHLIKNMWSCTTTNTAPYQIPYLNTAQYQRSYLTVVRNFGRLMESSLNSFLYYKNIC